ncbi:hypothetical protein C0J45_0786 [Silurus meridionalis]|nr:hypothetical protein C0J45_0786 [Silurus meridionalis]
MDFLRSKLEGSLDALMKIRQELEPLLVSRQVYGHL